MIEQSLDIPVESPFICRFCGKAQIIQNVKRGRPRQYCGDTCKNAFKYLDHFIRNTENVTFTEIARKSLRGDLLTFMNQTLPAPVKSQIGTEINESNFSETLNQISGVLKGCL